MRYVQRDKSGNIVGDYARLQPGFAEEALPDDAPELVERNKAIAAERSISTNADHDTNN